MDFFVIFFYLDLFFILFCTRIRKYSCKDIVIAHMLQQDRMGQHFRVEINMKLKKPPALSYWKAIVRYRRASNNDHHTKAAWFLFGFIVYFWQLLLILQLGNWFWFSTVLVYSLNTHEVHNSNITKDIFKHNQENLLIASLNVLFFICLYRFFFATTTSCVTNTVPHTL